MRQFGLDQPIPMSPHQPDHLHSITLAGRNDYNWPHVHKDYIAMWENRIEQCVIGRPLNRPLIPRSEYMRWYKTITRRWISPTSTNLGVVVSSIPIITLLNVLCIIDNNCYLYLLD